MRRIYLGYQAAILQAAQLGIKLRRIVGKAVKFDLPARFRKKRGPLPRYRRGKEETMMPRVSLFVDRSSSFNKMRHAVNQGATPVQPDQRAVLRHKVRRVEIRRAQTRAIWAAMDREQGR